MKFGRRLFAAAAVPLLAAGIGLTAAGTAHAATSPVYTKAGATSVAGWAVRSAAVNMTHTQGRYGSSGDGSWDSLPLAAGLAGVQAGTDITSQVNGGSINGGIGQELCDTVQGSPGYAAQEGLVQVAAGQFDVIESIGYFGSAPLNKDGSGNGDVCLNGLLGVASGSHVVESKVLLTGIRADDTVDMNTLYNARTNYSVYYNGGSHAVTRGHVTFAAQDLMTGAIGFDTSIAGAFVSQNFITNEAAQGVVADTAASPALTGVTVPAPNGGILEKSAPAELVRVAHSGVAGNSVIAGRHEVTGSFFGNSAWTATPVVSTSDGTANGQLYLDTSDVSADNFYVSGGTGLITPTTSTPVPVSG